MRNTYKFNLGLVLLVLMISLFTITSCSNTYSEFAGLTDKETYYVTFKSNGGNEKDSSVKLILPINTVEESKFPTVTKSNYTFNSWNTKEDGSGTFFTSSTKVSSNITVYAQWSTGTGGGDQTAKTVTFDANGGSGSMGTQSIAEGASEALTVNAFTRTGYTFNGWNTAADGTGTTYADRASFTIGSANVTLYAKWTANSYSVAFDGNGSTSGSMSNQAFTYDETAKALTANSYTKTGYTFAGWATTADGTVTYTNEQAVQNLSATNNSTITLYAQWRGVPYKVAFNKNNDNASGTMGDQDFNVDITQVLSANTYTRTGYYLTGWATTPEGEVIYSDSEAVRNLSETKDTVITLYAKWSANSYSVAFDGNGSTGGSMSNQTFTYDETAKALTANSYTKTGYTFTGWATTADGTVTYTNEQAVQNLVATNGTTYTLYAVWVPNTVQTVTVTLASSNEATIGLVNNSGTMFTANTGFSSYQWYLDRVLVSGTDTTSNTYTYDTTNLSVGNHTVMVLVNGNRSATATLTVQRTVAY